MGRQGKLLGWFLCVVGAGTVLYWVVFLGRGGMADGLGTVQRGRYVAAVALWVGAGSGAGPAGLRVGARNRGAGGEESRPVRLLVLYFSGTGNTDYVARYLAARVGTAEVAGATPGAAPPGTAVGAVAVSGGRAAPVVASLVPVETTSFEHLPDHDLLALGFPVYECDSPRFLRKEILRLPHGEGRAAFVFCTKGAVAGGALRRNLLRLARRGYVPCGYACVRMPATDGLLLVGKGSWPARAFVRRSYDVLPPVDALARRIARVADGLRSGESAASFRVRLPLSVPGLVLNPLLALIYAAVEGRIRRGFRADERCDGCGVCVRICPSGNIAFRDGKVVFLDRCYLCLRCVHCCPREAIQIGSATVGKVRWRGPKGDFVPPEPRGA